MAHSVLIVDDDADIRDTLSDILTLRGYAVATAANGAEALRYLRSQPRPCLILLDLMMPMLDGWDFRMAQLADEQIASVPVAVISGTPPESKRMPSADAYLRKPLELSSVLDVVAHYCATR